MKKAFLLILLLSAVLLGAQDFVINMGEDDVEWNLFQAYNTIEAQIFTGLYEGLVIYHPSTNKPMPGLAENWTLSEDKKTYTFLLRENLFYSNGDPITAEHFRQSWVQALDPHRGSRFASLLDVVEGAVEYHQGMATEEELGIEVISPRELRVTLVEPAPQFLSILCHYSFALAHPLLHGLDDWSTIVHVPSSGPYQIARRSVNEVLLEKNPHYWDADQVELDRIRLLFNQSPESAMNSFNDYKIDWMLNGMDSSLLEDGNKMVISPSFATSYFFFSNNSAPWDQPELRRALSLLLPWQDIRGQYLIPGITLVPPVPQYPDMENYFYQDQEQAMALLEETGYPQGQGLPPIRILLDASQWGSSVPRLIQESWEQALETRVTIDTLPSYLYYDALSQADYTLGYISWVGDYADPMTFLQMWKSNSSFNDGGYNNPEFDELLSQAAMESDAARYQLLSQAEQILLEGAEVLPVQHVPSLHLIDLRYIDGWYPNALDIHPLKDLGRKNGVPIPGLAQSNTPDNRLPTSWEIP